MKFTVFGAGGFIGANLTRYLGQRGHEVITPSRFELVSHTDHLGHVIYSIGLTGNFRQQPFETVDAHVIALAKRMQRASYDSWLYLSSTRVYGSSCTHGREADKICVSPSQDSIYDISKLLGESLCVALGRPEVRVARLANVYGVGQSRHTFLGSLLEDVGTGREIVIHEAPESSKDYIAISDVVSLIEKIALSGQHQMYNLASGTSTRHCDLADALRNLTTTSIKFLDGASRRSFPLIDVTRITDEFSFMPRHLLNDLSKLVLASNNHQNMNCND